MRAVDFIAKYIDEQGMTQSEAAAVVGWSRQNFWDKLNNRNPRYSTMVRIITAFGFELHVARLDGKPLDFDEDGFLRLAEQKNIYYDTLEDFMLAMGYKFDIVKKPVE